MKTHKSYVRYKPCKEPQLICKFHRKGPFINLYDYGIRFNEDDIGYYTLRGELIVSIQ